MKWILLGVFLWCVLLVGCRPRGAPEFDTLESQLLIETLDALNGDDPAKAVRTLQRLNDTKPGLEFVQLAVADEREKEILKYVDGKLSTGHTAQLGREIRAKAASESGFRSWDQAAELLVALEALEAYTAMLPYREATAMERSLGRLSAFHGILGQAECYNRFIHGQHELLVEMKKAESLSALGLLLQSLDEAVVSGSSDTASLIASIAETEVGSFVLLLDGALSTGSASAFSRALAVAPDTREREMVTEILGWLRRDCWEKRLRSVFFESVDISSPFSRSGRLLKARICLEKKDLPQALMLAKHALKGISPARRDVQEFIETSILSPEQFYAWCWASPCPGLSEYLVRLEQVRQYQRSTEDE